jgi:hypothetical protein
MKELNNTPGPKRIYLVENDDDTCMLISRSLTADGYCVKVFRDDRELHELNFMMPCLFIIDNTHPYTPNGSPSNSDYSPFKSY